MSSQKNIVVVDDHKRWLDLFEKLNSQSLSDFTFFMFADPLEALNYIRQNQKDIAAVVVDLVWETDSQATDSNTDTPVGAALIDDIFSRGISVPVLLCTQYDRKDSRVEKLDHFLETGMVSYINKDDLEFTPRSNIDREIMHAVEHYRSHYAYCVKLAEIQIRRVLVRFSDLFSDLQLNVDDIGNCVSSNLMQDCEERKKFAQFAQKVSDKSGRISMSVDALNSSKASLQEIEGYLKRESSLPLYPPTALLQRKLDGLGISKTDIIKLSDSATSKEELGTFLVQLIDSNADGLSVVSLLLEFLIVSQNDVDAAMKVCDAGVEVFGARRNLQNERVLLRVGESVLRENGDPVSADNYGRQAHSLGR